MSERIAINSGVCGGEPCIKGTRVQVALIAAMHENGDSVESLLVSYPHLTREDILAAIEYKRCSSIAVDKSRQI